MSSEAAVSTADSSASALKAEKRTALRIAFGVTACFAVVEAFDWDATFLAPLLASSMLVRLQHPPSFAQGLAIVIVFALSAGAVLLLTAMAISNPAVLILSLALLMYLSFYGHRRGAPDLATLLPQVAAVTIPVVGVISPQLSGALASTLVSAGVVALLAVWAAHAAFPVPTGYLTVTDGERPTEPPPAAARNALLDTLALLPPLAWFILDGTEVAVVILIVIVLLLRVRDSGHGARAALGVILANLIGGVAAAIVFTLVFLDDTFLFFVAICLAASLVFAAGVAAAGQLAPVVAIAFATFILLLGLGISPLPGSSGEFFIDRLINVLLASAYTIGALSVLARWRPAGALSDHGEE